MKLKIYIHAKYCEFRKEYDSEHFGVVVEETEVEFTPPPYEVLVNGTIAAYRAKQKKIRADAESEVNILQQRINDLLCIENKSETAYTE